MAKLHVERVGGLAGFGGAGSHIRSHGEVDTSGLCAAEQQAIEALFHSHRKAKPSQARDAFRYRISRMTPAGVETVEVPEQIVPPALSQCVKDELVEF
jgi:hypothetical protein